MKTVLITGGCGFIGSNFIRGFLKSHPDWKVINFDKLTYCGNRQNAADFEKHPSYQFIQGDICDSKLVAETMKQAEAVIHFAAETHVDRSIESAEDFLMTNMIGTYTLLEAAKRSSVKRFIHISTDEVYGSISVGAAKEEDSLAPNSPYSASKAGADLLARSYWKTYGFPVIITRTTNNYGPYQFPEKVLPLFITNLLENKTVPLYGDGRNCRDWVYVEDNCAALELVFDKGVAGQIYNIAGEQEKNNLELTRTILKEMGQGEDKIRYVEDRLGHDFRYSVDSQKISALGFKPKYSFIEGLRKTIQWYKDHPEWWQPLKQDKFTIK